MEEQQKKEIDLIQLFKTVWQRRKNVLKWSLIGLAVGFVISLSIPKEYLCEVKIIPEKKTPNAQSSMGALAGLVGVSMTNADAGLTETLYPEVFKSTPFLLEFTNIKVPLKNDSIMFSDYILKNQKKAWWKYITGFPHQFIDWVLSIGKGDQPQPTIWQSQSLQEAFTGSLSQKVKVEEDKKTGVLTISSEMQNPQISYIITDSLFHKLQRYVAAYRTEKARRNLEVSKKMFADAQTRYYISDSLYAISADRNLNMISKAAQIKVERLKNDKELAFEIYQQLATQVRMDMAKLQEETPIATVLEPARLPLSEASPNKMLIIIAFTFLGTMLSTVVITFKILFK